MAYLRDEIKAGIIVITSLVILSVFIILIGRGEFFETFDIYYLRIMNAAGLDTGAQVRLAGVRVGRILDITAPKAAGEPVTIKIGIKKGTPLYKGTKALITQVGFVGDIYLLLSVNNTSNERLTVGDTIPTEENVQFAQLMTRLDGISQSLDSLIKDIDLLFSQKNVQGIETLITNTNAAIVSGSQNLEKVASALTAASNKLQLVLNEIEEIARENKGEVSQLLKTAREKIERAGEMIAAIEETAKTTGKTARSLDRAVNLQSENIDSLLKAMTRTTEELKDLLQEMKNKPWSIIYQEKAREE